MPVQNVRDILNYYNTFRWPLGLLYQVRWVIGYKLYSQFCAMDESTFNVHKLIHPGFMCYIFL